MSTSTGLMWLVGCWLVTHPVQSRKLQNRPDPDGIKGDLNQASVSLGLVLLMLVVFTNCSFDIFCAVT